MPTAPPGPRRRSPALPLRSPAASRRMQLLARAPPAWPARCGYLLTGVPARLSSQCALHGNWTEIVAVDQPMPLLSDQLMGWCAGDLELPAPGGRHSTPRARLQRVRCGRPAACAAAAAAQPRRLARCGGHGAHGAAYRAAAQPVERRAAGAAQQRAAGPHAGAAAAAPPAGLHTQLPLALPMWSWLVWCWSRVVFAGLS